MHNIVQINDGSQNLDVITFDAARERATYKSLHIEVVLRGELAKGYYVALSTFTLGFTSQSTASVQALTIAFSAHASVLLVKSQAANVSLTTGLLRYYGCVIAEMYRRYL